MIVRRVAAACAAAAIGIAAAACSSGSSAHRIPPAPLPAASFNPRVAPAVAAYVAFLAAADAARQHPTPSGRPAAGSPADFASIAVDPARAQTISNLAALSERGLAWRGTPPRHQVFVLSTRLDAKPYPAMTLGDCALPSPSWLEYTVADGSAVSNPSTPMHRVTAEVVMRTGHWLVRSTAVDPQHVCH